MLNNTHRYNVLWGGASSGKSYFVAQKLTIKAMQSKRRVLVVRNTQSTIRESIFKDFVEAIKHFKLTEYCQISTYQLRIELPNGSEIIFKGLDDIEKMKSISGIADIVIEEASEISKDKFSQLDMRIRSKAKNRQIHLMFNPVSKDNWVYNEFFENEKEDCLIIHSTYKDNPHVSDDLVKAIESQKKTNPIYYSIYALGDWGTLGQKVYENWIEQKFNYTELIAEMAQEGITPVIKAGLDFGYVSDPTCIVLALINEREKKLYIFDEHCQTGMLNSQIADTLIAKGWHKLEIFADSAEPKSIADLRRAGISNIKPAFKGSGSISYGIARLHEYAIIVHPKCKNIINEFKNYTYKQDKNGNYISKPIDKYNHCLDALRYLIVNGRTKSKFIRGLSKASFGF